MATLVKSLQLLFIELDVRWPHRTRNLDGWARNCRYTGGSSSDHCYDSQGRVHAIDVDKIGIDAEWLFRHLQNSALPTQYVIWNRRISNRAVGNWRIRPYHGTSNPHTNHVHISIVHADWARNYDRGWGVAPRRGGITGPSAPPGAPEDSTQETPWDYRPYVQNSANRLGELASGANSLATAMRRLRG